MGRVDGVIIHLQNPVINLKKKIKLTQIGYEKMANFGVFICLGKKFGLD